VSWLEECGFTVTRAITKDAAEIPTAVGVLTLAPMHSAAAVPPERDRVAVRAAQRVPAIAAAI
jgi:hypothetical protein